jgi:hypothetical protein
MGWNMFWKCQALLVSHLKIIYLFGNLQNEENKIKFVLSLLILAG